MRIRVVHLGGALNDRDHGHGDNIDDNNDDGQEVIKKEVVEESLKSMEDNLTLAQLSNSNTNTTTNIKRSPSPSSQGKGKKSNEVIIKLSQPKKRKKKLVSPHDAGQCVRVKQEKATTSIGLSSPGQVKSPTVIRAEEVQLSLGHESPSFLKLLVRSHVSSCFWMGLPVPFCRSYLPRKDTTVMLENENGEQFELKYIADKTGLSAGWRKFAVGHKLLEGDVLIFHLVEANKFKVYIIRANDLTEVDGALSLLNLDAHMKQNDAGNEERTTTTLKLKKRKRINSLALTVVQKKNKRIGLSRSEHQQGQLVEQSGNDCEDVGSEVLEGSKFSGPAIRFKDITRFEEFHIQVYGLCIDPELSERMRMLYYELCCSKNAYLHDHLLPDLSCKLVAGVIGETVKIADAVRACKLTSSRNEFAVWEKSLKSFELLGMNVGFLRKRLRQLLRLAFETEEASDTKRFIEAKTERARTEDEIRNLESKLKELNEASEKYDADIETLKPRAETYELKFQEEVDAPW